MTVESPACDLLATLTTALQSANSTFPDSQKPFLPPADGISLLDVKNDLLLSYLQNLVFLVIIKIRNRKATEDANEITPDVVKKLGELRTILERVVRPVEGKLKYQIDKVVRAAEESDRRAAQKSSAKANSKTPTSTELGGDVSDEDESSDEDSEEGDSIMNAAADADASAAPRQIAMLRNAASTGRDPPASKSRSTASGLYKPPRITPTAMPQPTSQRDRDAPARKRKSQLLDEYIDEELSTAPRAQSSIGANNTIVKHGRGAMSTRDREKEKERTDYEERNFVRLPGESKADKKKAKLRGETGRRDMFGGEDWTGLGGLGDRINRTVAGRSRGEPANVLERRQKRGRDTQDGPRGDGVGIGESFEKRRKIVQQRADKKMRRKG